MWVRPWGKLAAELDFVVWVVDDRAEYVSEERFPRAERRISGAIDAGVAGVGDYAGHLLPDCHCVGTATIRRRCFIWPIAGRAMSA